jgi:phage-related protein
MIEAARIEDGTSPVDDYLNALSCSKREVDRDRLARILIRFEAFAKRGELEVPRELNELRDGLWEFKAQRDRIPFFYLHGDKPRALRVTHGFLKRQLPTPLREINWALRIRREDLAS